ncbi:MAG: hypothetical protein ABI182_03705 [Candidatus Baltobacteraceae bacterium]
MASLTAQAQEPIVADVLIGAGHEGRPQSCAQFPGRKCNMGAPGEIEWTPIVADEAARVLRAHGVSVARLPADFHGHYDVDAAIFIHFDGHDPVCGSSASIGYHTPASEPAAKLWRRLYGRYWPFGFQEDNFTENLSRYYGFRQVTASRAALVIELGEITCPQQKAWIAARLQWQGQLLAYFLSDLIGKGNLSDPGAFRE